MKISIITQIRNESKRLEEWIHFHKKFYDIDLFSLYLDWPEDDTEEVLKKLSVIYNIEYQYTDKIGEYCGNNGSVAVERQRASFKDGFNRLKVDYDWIGVFDVDEWIVPKDLNDYDFKKYLGELNENMVYLPMYNFTPPFDYNKSITEQNFYRWSTEERFANGHGTCGKSIMRGKILLDRILDVNVHTGPENASEIYHKNVDFESKNHKFRLHQWQSHMNHVGKKYEVYDDSIKKMLGL